MVIAKKFNFILKQNENNRLSHAFLVETNNIDLCLNDVKEIIKIINKSDENNVDKLIDINNLPSLQIIEAESSIIKKSQIEELIQKFSTKPIYSKYNNYIILNGEKLNDSSSNSLLKFLEEPEDNIIGFILVNNKENVLPTIKSRCEIIHVDYEEAHKYDDELVLIANEYLDKILNSDDRLINKDLINNYGDRDLIEKILLIIFNKYYNNYLNNLNIKEKNDKILKIIQDKINYLKSNTNIELLLDCFVIEMRKLR